MSAVAALGIDFGTDTICMGCARKGGVDILDNEVSNRLTPVYIGFGEKERAIVTLWNAVCLVVLCADPFIADRTVMNWVRVGVLVVCLALMLRVREGHARPADARPEARGCTPCRRNNTRCLVLNTFPTS